MVDGMLNLESFFFLVWFFVFKQKTAYEMRISDWSSDVCSSDLYCRWSTRAFIAAFVFCKKVSSAPGIFCAKRQRWLNTRSKKILDIIACVNRFPKQPYYFRLLNIGKV